MLNPWFVVVLFLGFCLELKSAPVVCMEDRNFPNEEPVKMNSDPEIHSAMEIQRVSTLPAGSKKNFLFANHFFRKPASNGPFNFDKHDNILWKIAGVFFLAGLFFLGICGIAILKVNQGSIVVLLYGFLLGLALVLISLPFMIAGAIID